MRNATFLTATSIVFATALPVMSQDTPAPVGPPSWFEWDHATGDRGGTRSRLKDRGIDFALNLTGDFLANPEGGEEQGSAAAYRAYSSIALDFEKLSGVRGLSFYLAAMAAGGQNISEDDIGNVFRVAQVYSGDEPRLAELYFEHTLAHGIVEFAIGRLATGTDFVAAKSFDYYVSGGINGNPGGIDENFPSFTGSPFVQWGARVTVTPSDLFYVSAVVYNAGPDVQNESNNGVDFTLNPEDGVLTLVEVGLTPNQGPLSNGLPGRYAISGVFDSSDYETLQDPDDVKSGNHGFYAIAEQMI
ncbi:MAG: carbohydrate porin [Pseudomonadota bacterium]